MTTSTDLPLRDWGLQRLPEADAERVEEALFVDASVADAVDDVRRDVLDDLVAGRLDLHAAPPFVQSVRGRTQLLAARALQARRRRPSQSGRRRFFARVAALAAMLLLAITATWFATRERIDQLPTLSLRAAAQRAATPIDVELPVNQGTLRLQAEVAGADATHRYRLRIVDENGVVFESASLSMRQVDAIRFVEAAVPASKLAPGVHRIVLAQDGATEIDGWEVNVR